MGAKLSRTGPAAPAFNQQEWVERIAAWSPEERAEKEKRFVRRIDKHLLPILVSQLQSAMTRLTVPLQIFVYILNYIDRNALPAARVQGLDTDLELTGDEYNIAISVLFVGYVSMQVPSNMILGIVRPSWYLGGCMAVWGIVSGCTGAVQSFGGLVACRFFSGITE